MIEEDETGDYKDEPLVDGRNYDDKPLIIKSTPDQIKDFRRSLIWDDIKREIRVWIAMARDGLEDVDSSPKEDLINKGRIQSMRYFLEMPRVLYGSAKEELERREDER